MAAKTKTYEIVHPLGTTTQINGNTVMTNADSGQTVIYSSESIIFNNIVAVVPADCLIYQVIKSTLTT